MSSYQSLSALSRFEVNLYEYVRATAEEMIDVIKGSKMLNGFRGSKASDKVALAHALVNVSKLLADHHEITNLDINPIIVLEKGEGCVAVDVKIQVEA